MLQNAYLPYTRQHKNIQTPIHTYDARTAYLIITVAWGKLNTTRRPSSTCLILNSHQSSENSKDFFPSSFVFPLKSFTRLKGINWNEYINHGSQSIIINWVRYSMFMCCFNEISILLFIQSTSWVLSPFIFHRMCDRAKVASYAENTSVCVSMNTESIPRSFESLRAVCSPQVEHLLRWQLANERQNGISVMHIYHLPIENRDRLQCDLFSLAVPLSLFGLSIFLHTNGSLASKPVHDRE